MRVWNGGFGDEVADRAESVEALGDGPGETFAFCFVLDVAGCHVDCEEVTYSPPPQTPISHCPR